ncbi:MAG: capsule biosynthesis protein CapA [Paracoccus sp. (in: a-proteobacteria)]|nr:capsule biosynthesis protein CapA [Paracoccus sp. (in: a-proteobacteria)]
MPRPRAPLDSDVAPRLAPDIPVQSRVFLLLQGPHGPFFDRLGGHLRAAGATVWRVAFNAGDAFFWSDRDHLIRHQGSAADWPAHLDRLLTEKGVTDIALYGDVRAIHADAVQIARARGLTIHIFEEGYLRPFWITYERGGSNGYSRLAQIDIPQMRAALRGAQGDTPRPPSHWGDMRQHKFYGALYHFLVLTMNRDFPGYRSHRDISLWQEFRLNLRRLLLTPAHAVTRAVETRRIRRGGFPYTLVLMQLEHDASFRAHSDFTEMPEFTDRVMEAFATNAPRHHHIVFKAHPLEDDRSRLRARIIEKARALGISHRVHYVLGGKLAPLLSQARSAVTVNSTAAQQALWRGLPVKTMGHSVYDKPGLVSSQDLAAFFVRPERPSAHLYRRYRDYLLETSQLPGGYYSSPARSHALRLVADMMLRRDDPYDALASGTADGRQQIEANIG